MKIIADQSKLADALNFTARAIEQNPPLPMFRAVTFEYDGDQMIVSGKSYDRWHSAITECDVDGPGGFATHGRLLSQLVDSLPPCQIELISEGSSLEVRAKRSRYKLPLMPYDHDDLKFPDVGEPVGRVPLEALRDAVSSAAATTGDSIPEVLMGVHLSSLGDSLHVLATDRYHMHVETLRGELSAFQALPPGRNVADGLAAFDGDDVTISCDQNTITLVCAGRSMTLRLLDLEGFPANIERLAPEPDVTCVVDVDELVTAIKRATLVDREWPLDLEVEPDHMEIKLAGSDSGEASEYVDASADGSTSTRCGSRLLVASSTALRAKSLRFVFSNNPQKPVVIKPADVDDDSIWHMFMPIRKAPR